MLEVQTNDSTKHLKRSHFTNKNVALGTDICTDGKDNGWWGGTEGWSGRTLNLMCPKFGFDCGDCSDGYNNSNLSGPTLEEINSGKTIRNGVLLTDPMHVCGTGYVPPDVEWDWDGGGSAHRGILCNHCWDDNKHCDCIGQCFDASILQGENSFLADGVCDISRL